MKKHIYFIGILVFSIVVLSSCGGGGYNKKLSSSKTLLDSFSFAAGRFFAEQQVLPALRQSGDDTLINIPLFMSGIESAFKKDTSVAITKIYDVINRYFQEKSSAQHIKDSIDSQANNAAGRTFLEENKNKEGVVQLENGLQYKITKEGNGPTPKADDRVRVHYEGTLIDGTVFDSSYERGEPAEFSLSEVIKGWTEGFQHLKEGSEAILYVPSDLAYGDMARSKIPGGSTLIFKIELLNILKSNNSK